MTRIRSRITAGLALVAAATLLLPIGATGQAPIRTGRST